MDQIAAILNGQDGVIARRQFLDSGLGPHDVARMLRSRELAPLHPGVYVAHTGVPTWHQRAWGGVLFAWPAALTHASALRAAEGPGRQGREDRLVEVAVAAHRRVVSPPGMRMRRIRGLDERVLWHLGPPRTRYDDAVLDVATEQRSDVAVLATLADACGGRRTTAARLLEAAAARPRLPRRDWLTDALADIAEGTCSVLEHGYLHRVERAHGLPRGTRQVSHRHGPMTSYSDVEHADFGLIIELDGRLFHDSPTARDADLDRDLLAAATEDAQTLRIGYRQVFDRPCRTAAQVGAVLNRRGWNGAPSRCPLCA